MTDLIKRLEEAEAGGRELDAAIAVLIGGFFAVKSRLNPAVPDYGYFDAEGAPVLPGHGGDQMVPRYTTSLDAALALAERVLPGWHWDVRHWAGRKPSAIVTVPECARPKGSATFKGVAPSGVPFDGPPRNPDGPEAADTLERQAAEIERLRGLLLLARPFVADDTEETCDLADRIDAALTGEDHERG